MAKLYKISTYLINLFCLTANETARYLAEKGESSLAGSCNIGYWPWKLGKWPAEWISFIPLMDEIWVYSRHIYDAFSPVSQIPVLVMPLPLEVGEISDKDLKDFNLPLHAFLFCFSFDLNSSIHRKNPMACLRAFQKTFPAAESEEEAGLVIKCHKPAKFNADWEALKATAQNDTRIRFIEETLPRPDTLALFKSCDCCLSLHRAEGFGLGITEALLPGLRAIVTGYSGNMDFCRDNPNARLAAYSMTPARNGQYPHAAGQLWADADIGDAAKLMREIIKAPKTGNGVNDPRFSLKNIGARYAERLKFIKYSRIFAKTCKAGHL